MTPGHMHFLLRGQLRSLSMSVRIWENLTQLVTCSFPPLSFLSLSIFLSHHLSSCLRLQEVLFSLMT